MFWENSLVSFREHIYENGFMKEDFSYISRRVERVLSPLFSPKNEFILPLDWIWGEQELMKTNETDAVVDEEVEESITT